jgi:cytochrome c peroxidase
MPTTKYQIRTGLFLYIMLIIGCSTSDDGHLLNIPKHFPTPNIPADNPLTMTSVELGRLLFFDPMLSKDSTVSCASCHLPKFAFSDTISLSNGIHQGKTTRNTPSLINVAYTPLLNKDGGVLSLEKQVIAPLENPNEMGFQLQQAAERMAQNPMYQKMSKKAYKREFSPYVLVRALAAFQRTLIDGASKYDKHLNRPPYKTILNASEKNGMQLFFSKKTNCSTCHSGVLFTNFKFENNGLYEVYKDVGRAGVSLKQADKFKFRVPSLRNIELTAPYMFDGSLNNLEAVIEHYNRGAKKHYQQNPLIRPLHLTPQEQKDLINFLKTLTTDNGQ